MFQGAQFVGNLLQRPRKLRQKASLKVQRGQATELRSHSELISRLGRGGAGGGGVSGGGSGGVDLILGGPVASQKQQPEHQGGIQIPPLNHPRFNTGKIPETLFASVEATLLFLTCASHRAV